MYVESIGEFVDAAGFNIHNGRTRRRSKGPDNLKPSTEGDSTQSMLHLSVEEARALEVVLCMRMLEPYVRI